MKSERKYHGKINAKKAPERTYRTLFFFTFAIPIP